MKIISILYCLAILSGFTQYSCESDCGKPIGIGGEWVWIKSTGFATFTPENAGYTKSLFIDDFVFKEFINDTLSFESQYDLVIRVDSLLGDKTYIEFESGSELRIYLNETELILDPEFQDVPIEHYNRK